MSSRHEVSRRRGRSRSRSPEARDRRGRSTDRRRSPDRRRHSRSPAHSKHTSRSRDRRSRSTSIAGKHRSTSRGHKKSKKSKESSKSKKSKKKKRHSSSSSSDSSSGASSASGEEELQLLQRLEAERERLRLERKKEKEAMKANETPEEKRARRLREKQAKERKRRERMGWDGEYQCYTDQDNPFGDSALTHTFVWSKKLANEGVKTVSREELDAQNRQKQLENKIELEKVKQRRLEREAERAAREAEAAAAARAREAAQFSSWERHEDAFHLQQARLRSQIRIRDGRAKPIDLLAWYVSSEHLAEALEMHEPYTYLHGLRAPDLSDLLEDIKVYKELENNANQQYWEDVETIVRDEAGRLRDAGGAGVERTAVHRAVAADVTQIFKGKTGAQLEALQTQIEQKISGRRDGVDVGYWESLLSQLKAHRARARLRDRHQANLRRKLQLLKQEQGVQGGAEGEGHEEGQGGDTRGEGREEAGAGEGGSKQEDRPQSPAEPSTQEPVSDEEDSEAACTAAYCAGRYSPAPLSPAKLEPGTLVLDAAEDSERLNYLRMRLHAGNAQREHAEVVPSDPATTSADPLAREAGRGMAPGEAQFSVEVPLDRPLWPDKYRPRKPRYFNRVHTGFEWNKYNQTHYDMDNPPPKVVQGYKFNIFYPDLIHGGATPEFSLKPCADNPEFAVLRFHAGPPYEDIAFKIVNREWEYSYKRGFRCHFHNNIFQLWFHFKRYRYRR